MKSITRTTTLAALLALNIGTFGTAGTAIASDDHKHHNSAQHQAQTAEMAKQFGLISEESAIQIALKSAPGVVKEIELDDRKKGKGWKYEVDIVDANGREWEVDIDAKTGAVLKSKKDWF